MQTRNYYAWYVCLVCVLRSVCLESSPLRLHNISQCLRQHFLSWRWLLRKSNSQDKSVDIATFQSRSWWTLDREWKSWWRVKGCSWKEVSKKVFILIFFCSFFCLRTTKLNSRVSFTSIFLTEWSKCPDQEYWHKEKVSHRQQRTTKEQQ